MLVYLSSHSGRLILVLCLGIQGSLSSCQYDSNLFFFGLQKERTR